MGGFLNKLAKIGSQATRSVFDKSPAGLVANSLFGRIQSQGAPRLPPGIGNAYGVGAQSGAQIQMGRRAAQDRAELGIGSMAGSARAMQGSINPTMAMASNQMQQEPVDTITAMGSNQMQPTPINPAAFSNTAAIENMYGAQVPDTFTRSVGPVDPAIPQPAELDRGQEFINDYNT